MCVPCRSLDARGTSGAALAAVAGCATLAVAGGGSSTPPALALADGHSCVAAFPSPGSATASRTTQISLRGAAPGSATSSTVTITASATGTQTGRWVADSDGQGANSYPSAPIARGERVTIHTGLTPCGGRGAPATFATSRAAGALAPKTGAAAAPTTLPSVVASPSGSAVRVGASRNGATQVARWQVVGGPTASDMSTLGSAPRAGFRTPIAVPASTRFMKVVPIDANGATLATSAVVAVRAGAVAPETVTP